MSRCSCIFPAFGLSQEAILPGGLHWLIQIVHLLLGIGAMYLARGVERRYLRLVQEIARDAALAMSQGAVS